MPVKFEIYKYEAGEPHQISNGELPDTNSVAQLAEPKGHIAWGGKELMPPNVLQIALTGFSEIKGVLTPGVTAPIEIPHVVNGQPLPDTKAYQIDVTWNPAP